MNITHTHTHTHTHIYIYIHKTFIIVSSIVLIICYYVIDTGGILLSPMYDQEHVRLTTLLGGEGCNGICTPSNNFNKNLI
jgi:hypothetical protein